MKRLKVVHLQGSLSDFQDIYEYLRERGASATIARAYVRRLRSSCDRIGDAPEGGTARSDLEAGIRTWTFERRAVIAYKVMAGEVAVTNVFYGGRDIEGFYRRKQERAVDTT